MKKDLTELGSVIDQLYFLYTHDVDDETLVSLTENLCNQFAKMYVRPQIAPLKKDLANMKFVYLSDENQQGNFTNNTVHLNMQFVLNGTDRLDRFNRVITMMSDVAHEYEHSFQYEYSVAVIKQEMERLSKNKHGSQSFLHPRQSEEERVYKEIIGSRASVIARSFATQDYSDKNVDTMLRFFKGLSVDVESVMSDEDKENPQKLCKYALYFNRACEEDAREKAYDALMEFLEDVERVLDNSNEYSDFLEELKMQGVSSIYQEARTQEIVSPVYEKLKKALDNLSAKDYVAFGKMLENEGIIAASDAVYFSDPKTSYAEFFVKKQILLDAFDLMFLPKFVGDEKNIDKLVERYKGIVNLRLAFLKHGLSSSLALVDEKYRQMSFLEPKFKSGYHTMLKEESVTSNSFDRVGELTPRDKLDILKTYVESGRYSFASSMISALGDEIKEYIGISQKEIDDLKKKNDEADSDVDKVILSMDIENYEGLAQFEFVGPLKTALSSLESQQKSGKLCFDDIDEMIELLAALSSAMGVPYYEENAKLSQNGSREARVAAEVYEMYKQAEKIGRNEACRLAGYQIDADHYRYAHRQDRVRFLLQGKEREKRIESVYGPNELARIQREQNVIGMGDQELEPEK